MFVFKRKTQTKPQAQIKPQTQTSAIREMSSAETQLVAGGINPQPLPPSRHVSM